VEALVEVRGVDVERGRLAGPNGVDAATAASSAADVAEPTVKIDSPGESAVPGAGAATLPTKAASCGDMAPKCAVDGADDGSENNELPLPSEAIARSRGYG